MSYSNANLKPMLHWAGGKGQLLSEIIPMIKGDYSIYVEPFLGGGALFFALQPENAIINDSNDELMNVYFAVKNNLEWLIKELKLHKLLNSSDYFYKIREWDRHNNFKEIYYVKRAARLIYLNKTCYNGLYRVNSSGEFNSPYGKYDNPNIVNEGLLTAISKFLNFNNIEIKNTDYKEILKDLDKNAFVYLDPPYMPISTSSSFTHYTKNGFTYENQVELRIECDKLTEQGIHFIQSNSYCEAIRELYKDYNIKEVKARRYINCNREKRGKINELLIYNY